MVPPLHFAPHPLFCQLEPPLVTLNLLHRGKKTKREGWMATGDGGHSGCISRGVGGQELIPTKDFERRFHFYAVEL